jgi:hypothetical protein
VADLCFVTTAKVGLLFARLGAQAAQRAGVAIFANRRFFTCITMYSMTKETRINGTCTV